METSADRVKFLSRLFARKPVESMPDSSPEALFRAYKLQVLIVDEETRTVKLSVGSAQRLSNGNPQLGIQPHRDQEAFELIERFGGGVFYIGVFYILVTVAGSKFFYRGNNPKCDWREYAPYHPGRLRCAVAGGYAESGDSADLDADTCWHVGVHGNARNHVLCFSADD
jgi:hypothetical protein